MACWVVEEKPKDLRETLCVAQTAIGALELDANTIAKHLNILQALIDECDWHRPLGPDGKHGENHTSSCGCEDGERDYAAEIRGK
jgi:hypothetical protein